MAFDYSSSFAGINNALSNIGKQNEIAYQRQRLANLGQQIQSGDYGGAAQAAFSAGDAGVGLGLLKLGETAKDRDAERQFFNSLGMGVGGAPVSTTGSGPASLINSESGGNWQAQNDAVGAGGARGHFGRAQFGQARIQDAANAGAIPQGTTPQQFMQSPELQKRAEAWHFGDIDNFIAANGYDKLIGQSINGVPITADGMRAVAHLGGTGGLRKFIESGGRYNPADRNGTTLMAYLERHQGSSGPAPQRLQIANPIALQPGVQVAETEEDVRRLEGSMPQQPVQVAQAPAQAGAPVSDVPAPGAAEAQGFAIPGTDTVVPQSLMNDPQVQRFSRLMMVAPTERARAAVKGQLDLAMRDAERRLTRSQAQVRPLTDPQDRARYGIPADDTSPYQVDGNGRVSAIGGNKTTVSINQKGETKFEEELGKKQADRWNGYIAEGDKAQGRLADIQTLRETSRRLGSQGSQANLKLLIGPFAESLGIQVEGLPDIQLYESIANRLAPQMRAPGSGATSDIEFKGFLRAIGPLSNNPAAREMIFDTFEAASRNDLARADIASRLASGDINRGQAEKELRALPTPLEAFREFRKQNPDLVGQAIKESARVDYEQRNAPPITSADAYGKLKPGDKYTDPDGNIRTKR